jgi:hypothetical protein
VFASHHRDEGAKISIDPPFKDSGHFGGLGTQPRHPDEGMTEGGGDTAAMGKVRPLGQSRLDLVLAAQEMKLGKYYGNLTHFSINSIF